MRNIEFLPNPNGVTKILVDAVELMTRIDPVQIREYRYQRHVYNIGFAEHIIQTVLKQLEGETIKLTTEEILTVIKYMRRQLGI